MENMTRHVKTDLAVSKASYSDDIPPESRLATYLNRPTKIHPHSPSKDSDTVLPRTTEITKPIPPKEARNKNTQAVQIK